MTSMPAGEGASGDPVDSGNAFKLLLSCPSGLPPSRVYVDFNPSYDRIPHPDANLEESINEIWIRRLKENTSLYNGKKFRYAGHTLHHVDGLDQESSVCLHLGLTDYRTFVGTNLNPLWEKFLIPSEDDPVRCQHTSSPLGNGAIVETSDKRILVLQRSYNVGEFPGYFVFPGGHSEPEELGISDHQNDKGLTESEDLNRKVSQEMFDGIVREVVEEIGVPAESLTDPVFIGISRREMNVRPTAFFFLKCNMESKKIYQLYSRAQDGFESTQLYTVSRDELGKMALRMPGCHHGGYVLYELMIQTVEDARQSSRWL
ncbi:nudix hydrolase 9 isoform X1 [Phoenix dactylifera]|uniref:Nudix hydrolase 9 isoform X1 n=1 Tax=Phoenix dactylifera TaxID=42345 RepID=A0A8B9AZW2_PHODC|nr:nudix hydrolase 9 isoform X1 [Phoenix dactylifera]